MNRPLRRYGRSVTAALAGLAIGLLVQLNTSSTASFRLVDTAQAAQAAGRVVDDADTLELAQLERKFAAIARTVAPSVVAISAASSAPETDEALRADEMTPQKLEVFLNKATRTVGTGFIFDADGYILTNEHVIGDCEQLWVTTDDRRIYPAIVVGSDPRSDLAVLKIPGSDFPAVRFADQQSVRRGQWAIALGNPYGLSTAGEMCMSVGVVSATDRSLPKLASKENRLYSNLLQTTAEINPGNSGGPLFGIDGAVIGVNTAVILPQKQTNGIGFAVPITPEFLSIVSDLKNGREVVYGYLGVMVSTPTPRARRSLGVGEIGARIDTIEEGSPADASPLKVGDVVTEVDGQPVRDGDHFVRTIGACPVDRPVAMKVYRDGRPTTLHTTLRKRQLPSVAVNRENQRFRWRGMLLGPAPQHWTAAAAPTGASPAGGLLVLGIDADSPMWTRGVRQGTVITSIAGRALKSIADLQQVINDAQFSDAEVQMANVAAEAAVVSLQE